MRKFSSAAQVLAACAVAVLFALAACKAPDGAGRSASAGAKLSSTPGAKPSASKPSATPADGVRRVTPEETKALVDKGQAVVVDVRDANSFKNGRIKGSLNIPRTETVNRLGELPKDKLIIFYCA